ncbi:MAG: hypothetical protein ACLTYN_12525 [Dysosmobacter welbionis]
MKHTKRGGCPCTAFWTGSGSRTIWQTWPPGLDAGPAGDLVLALPADRAEAAPVRRHLFAGAGRFSPAPAAGLDTFQDYCAQAGWHRAASSDQVQVFFSEDPAAVPIDTDPAAELENIRRALESP